VAENDDQMVIAIADGVGGWRKRGVDPAKFSRCLMDQTHLIVSKATENLGEVLLASDAILRSAFYALVQVYLTKRGEPFGSSTACILSLQKRTGQLDVANLGDSGMMLVREGRVVFRTESQQTRFNAPYQTTLRPTGDVDDMTHMAERTLVPVQDGDIILLATDGLWDNLWERDLLDSLVSSLDNTKNNADRKAVLDRLTRDVVMRAREAARSEKDSPFAVEAKKAGKSYSGGKPDDITCLLAVVHDALEST